MLFKYFERLVDTAGQTPYRTPPSGLTGFYWHFVRQNKAIYVALFTTGLAVALTDTAIPVFIGKLVGLMSEPQPRMALRGAAPMLIGMAALILVLRPLAILLDNLVRNNAIVPGITSRIRWQSHWQVVRQSLGFFQNDFAGRIANRVMSTANALRESVISSIRAVWYIMIYGASTLALLAGADWRLTVPLLLWLLGYLVFLGYFVPRMRDRGKLSAEAHSALMGRIVDSYTNILTVKLFARAHDEDAYVRDGIDLHRDAMSAHMRTITAFIFTLTCMNALMMAGTASIGLILWARGSVEIGVVAMALPLAWQIANLAGWVSWEVTAIFENIGSVQEGMQTIARPLQMPDLPDAAVLRVTHGEICFEQLDFAYDHREPVLRGLDLRIRPGERVGLIGRSGAGKSTLVNLLLRFYAPTGGRIEIDGQDIHAVTQESLRGAIGVVTQDTSLLHRSIAANIRYGRPQAADHEVETAARCAHAHAFIVRQHDTHGHTGYAALVGERGVKLSGGQRQRVALARVLLKDAPILILDEATSALDSEVEAAIQQQLEQLMGGKTVIAIAHRLSTIARMDRLIVLDQGRIVEQGRHEELLARGGHYAELWQRQSGGFIDPDRKPDNAAVLA